MVSKRKTSKFSKRTYTKTRKVLGGVTREELKNRNNMHKFEYILLPWIPRHRLDWEGLSRNPNAIDYLTSNWNWLNINWNALSINPNAIDILKERNWSEMDIHWRWQYLSMNPNAIPILEKNLKKVDWATLSMNPNAIHILKNNLGKIKWSQLSSNPNAIDLLKNNLDKINWSRLSKNPNAIPILENNLESVNWVTVCSNPNPKIIPFLERNLDFDKLSEDQWKKLSANPNAVHILENHLEKVDWKELSANPNAVPILKSHLENVDFKELSKNPNAMSILKNTDYNLIDWKELSENPSIFYRPIDNDSSLNKELEHTFNLKGVDSLLSSKTPIHYRVPETTFDLIKGYFGGKRKTTKRRK